jgi:gluconokinase
MIIVLMGVTGCGKTTVGEQLADQLHWTFLDADDFHPPENKDKMSKGIPLTDEDRIPWLQALANRIIQANSNGESCILACSALKRLYRQMIRGSETNVTFVYLKGPEELIAGRLEKRTDHFMNPALLRSQFSTLEEPNSAVYVDIDKGPDAIVSEIRRELRL